MFKLPWAYSSCLAHYVVWRSIPTFGWACHAQRGCGCRVDQRDDAVFVPGGQRRKGIRLYGLRIEWFAECSMRFLLAVSSNENADGSVLLSICFFILVDWQLCSGWSMHTERMRTGPWNNRSPAYYQNMALSRPGMFLPSECLCCLCMAGMHCPPWGKGHWISYGGLRLSHHEAGQK